MRSFLVGVLTAALAAPAPGAFSAQEQQEPLVFGTQVELVAIPVFVKDKKGAPIQGLSAEDFEIRDEGKRMPIVAFQEIEIDAEGPRPRMPSRETAAVAQRQFLLLFDLSFSSPGGIVRSRSAAAEFLAEHLKPDDLAAVATYSANAGLKMLVGFTTDRQQLSLATESLGVLRREGVPDPLGLAFELGGAEAGLGRADMGRALDGDVESQLRSMITLYRNAEEATYSAKIMDYLGSLRQLAEVLEAVQGRKQVILFSSGFQQTSLMGVTGAEAMSNNVAVAEGRIWEVRPDDHFGGQVEVRDAIERMTKAMAASDTIVHTVDVSGLATGGGDASSRVGESRFERGGESLSLISRSSGGMTIKNANNFDAVMGEILDASRHFYVVAFQKGESKGAGKFHDIKVKVRRKGVRVSHRSGYAEPDPDKPASVTAGRLQAAESIAKGITGGPIAVGAVAVPYRDAEGRVTVPVVLEIDGDSLLDRGAGSTMHFEVYAYALDAQGVIEDVASFSSKLDLDTLRTKLTGKGIQIHTAFELKEGDHDIRLLVRDAELGRTGSARLQVHVPSFAASETVLYPPLFMADPADWVVLPIPSSGVTHPELPFRVGASPFTVRGLPALSNGRTDSVCIMAFTPGEFDPTAQFGLGAKLIAANGGAFRIGRIELAESFAESDGFRRFVLNLTPADVSPGDYTLQVTLKDPRTGAVSQAGQPVRVQ